MLARSICFAASAVSMLSPAELPAQDAPAPIAEARPPDEDAPLSSAVTPTIITIAPQTGFGLPEAPAPADAPPAPAPVDARNPYSVRVDVAAAQRRAQQQEDGRLQPAIPPRQSTVQAPRCVERPDGVRCVTSVGTSPEARERAEALARGALDELSEPP